MDTPAESAAKKLAWNLDTQESVDLVATMTLKSLVTDQGKPADFDIFFEHYIGTAAGQRFLDYQSRKSGAIVNRSMHYADQGKFTDVNYFLNDSEKQQSVYVTNHFFLEDMGDRRQLPAPLLFFYVGRKTLPEALPGGEYLGVGECLGRECDIFLFKQVRWSFPMDQVFTLDKQTGVPLKVEMYRDAASRDQKRPVTVWVAKSLDSVQGHDLPLKSTTTAFTTEGAPSLIWEHSVESVKFNQTFPPSTFQPIIQPGVTVLDGVTKKMYATPGVKAVPPASRATVPTPSLAVQATPPRDWSGTVSIASAIVGLSLVTFGIVLWWRRR